MAGDVEADFGHGFDGQEVEPTRMGTGGIGLDYVGLQVPGPSFGYLALAGVSGAQEEHSERPTKARSRCWLHKTSGSMARICFRRFASFRMRLSPFSVWSVQ